MSMTGFAVRPGTAVLPICSIGPSSQGLSARQLGALLLEAARPGRIIRHEVDRFFAHGLVSAS